VAERRARAVWDGSGLSGSEFPFDFVGLGPISVGRDGSRSWLPAMMRSGCVFSSPTLAEGFEVEAPYNLGSKADWHVLKCRQQQCVFLMLKSPQCAWRGHSILSLSCGAGGWFQFIRGFGSGDNNPGDAAWAEVFLVCGVWSIIVVVAMLVGGRLGLHFDDEMERDIVKEILDGPGEQCFVSRCFVSWGMASRV
jgi:hypothetical protein